jgi:uncharacterized metal-binding protein YceD (DUF177 family)
MTPELHRPLPAERIGAGWMDFAVEATPAECAALARRMGLPAVLSLNCRFRLARQDGGAIAALGHLQARVMQTCVLSLEDFEAPVEETFTIRFVPSGQESTDIDPESEDEVPYQAGLLDLGEAAAEQLGLALDPYPRQPGAELPTLQAEEDTKPHPFAALAKRPRPN